MGCVSMVHPDAMDAVTFRGIWPITVARRVRWQVTQFGASGNTSVGAAGIAIYGAGPSDLTVARD